MPVRLGEVKALGQQADGGGRLGARRRAGPGAVGAGSARAGPERWPTRARPRRTPVPAAGSRRVASGSTRRGSAAYEVLRAVAGEDAYANLLLPGGSAPHGLDGRDAAFATELVAGTAAPPGHLRRGARRLCDRPSARALDPAVLDGAAARRAPAAGACGCRPTRRWPPRSTWSGPASGRGAAGFVNAVLRRVGRPRTSSWVRAVAPDPVADPIGLRRRRASRTRAGWSTSWRDALGRPGRRARRAAGGRQPAARVTLVARPGLSETRRAARAARAPSRRRTRRSGSRSPRATRPRCRPSPRAGPGCRTRGRSWSRWRSPPRRGRRAGRAVAGPLRRSGRQGCAARCAVAAQRGARLLAVERQPHRADLVEARPRRRARRHRRRGDRRRHRAGLGRRARSTGCSSTRRAPVSGALRRRPESRWRRTPAGPARTWCRCSWRC